MLALCTENPFRLCCVGPPNVGKTNVIYNIIYHKKPPFEKIFILHNDNSTKEYQNIDAEYLEELPDIEEIDPDVKQLIIIEDIDVKIFLGNKEVY